MMANLKLMQLHVFLAVHVLEPALPEQSLKSKNMDLSSRCLTQKADFVLLEGVDVAEWVMVSEALDIFFEDGSWSSASF